MNGSIVRLFLFGLLATALVSIVLPDARAGLDSFGNATVDQRVLDDTTGGRTAHFLVILQHQADAGKIVAQIADRQSQGQLLVSNLRDTARTSQPAVTAQLAASGAKYRGYWIVNMLAVEGDRAVVEALARHPGVRAIEPDRAFPVPLAGQGESYSANATGVEWGADSIQAPAVWTKGFTGQNIVYASADTGVQWDHPALKAQYRGWNGATADHNYSWWDAIHSDLNNNGSNPCGYSSVYPCDDDPNGGHGTHTLGTGVGSDGGSNQIGVAPGAKWISCRNMEEGVGRPSTYIECLQFFLAPTDLSGSNPDPNKRPDIISNSYGCPPSEGCEVSSLQMALEQVRAAGIFIAVSAGNSGPGCSTIDTPPGLSSLAFTVGATADQQNNVASFSSRGPVTVDGSNRRKPDIVAPGTSIRSSLRGDTYGTKSGTSMAAPHVAGTVALLWSAIPSLRGNVDHTEFILEHSAIPLPSAQACGGDGVNQIPNSVFGYGALDSLRAYYLAARELSQPYRLYLTTVFRN